MNEIGYLQGVGRVVMPVNTCLTIPFHLILTLIIMVLFYLLRKSTKMKKASNKTRISTDLEGVMQEYSVMGSGQPWDYAC